MKQFEKWLHGIAFPDPTTCGGVQHDYCGMAWRAVLEEILNQLKRPIYSADIIKWIEKELEEPDGQS